MKQLIISFFILFTSFNVVYGQSPQAFKYQAVVRDNANNILSNQNVALKILILEGSPSGNVVFSETHNIITNSFGLINLEIGTGTLLAGNFSSVNWGGNSHYVRIELDENGGSNYQVMGTSQLLSVPYALYAESSGGAGQTYTAGSGISITGNVISNISPDQNIIISGSGATTVSGTYPNFTISSTDNVNDADADPVNELQTISQTGTDITLSNGGGTFSIADGDTSLWRMNGSDIYRNSGFVGIGLSSPQYKFHVHDTLTPSKLYSSQFYTIGGNIANINFKGINSEIYGTNGNNRAIQGYSGGISSAFNTGVAGFADNSTYGNTGVLGVGSGTGFYNQGVYGSSLGAGDGSTNSRNIGIYGEAGNNIGYNIGIYGESSSSAPYNSGIEGFCQGTGSGASAQNMGGRFLSYGNSTVIRNYGILVQAIGGSTLDYGIYASAPTSVDDYAGYFSGNVTINGDLNVTGNISKGGGTFKIDHPLDPENKYLVHSFVESPEMINIYGGTIITGEDSLAIVKLPDYFEASNKDFRYQLTVIGSFEQAIIIKEISNNSFIIATSNPNVKVCWQVTAIRADNYANENRIVPEVEKSKENKGTYLHPKVYNLPIEKSENYRHYIIPVKKTTHPTITK